MKTKKNIKTNTSWGGRFKKEVSGKTQSFTSSLDVDRRLYLEDIIGSIEYAKSLKKAKILTSTELKKITSGLKLVLKDIENENFNWSDELEDVHMNIEAALVKKIGLAGKKIHTGRSRNDQVATDMKLYLRSSVKELQENITFAQLEVVKLAEKHYKTIMPGFTHMQIAQPVTLGHHMMAWYEMLQRDFDRFKDSLNRMNSLPLGSAALSGSRYKIDRKSLATNLGFSDVTQNSIDSVSDRDFIIELAASASILGMHLSRFCEEIVLWSSTQFNYVEISEEFCTGSSIMPQKKNPDVAEIIRGRSSRNFSALTGLLSLMKNLPLAYNRDMQEDKKYIFETLDSCIESLDIFAPMIKSLKVNSKKMQNDCYLGQITATDLADYLVMEGMPFRKAHEVVGKAVVFAEKQKLQLFQLDIKDLQKFSKLIKNDVYSFLDPEKTIYTRNMIGGTSPKQVIRQVKKAKIKLKSRK